LCWPIFTESNCGPLGTSCSWSCASFDAGKTHNDVPCKFPLHLEEIAVVDQPADNLQHVERRLRIRRHEGVHPFIGLEHERGRRPMRWIHHVVGWQERKQFLREAERFGIVRGDKVNVPADRSVRIRAPDFLHRDSLSRGRLDDVRATDEHVRALARHDDEVRQRR
jgi:hypothetical protein